MTPAIYDSGVVLVQKFSWPATMKRTSEAPHWALKRFRQTDDVSPDENASEKNGSIR
jgi:hypothetical protein